MIYEAAAYRRLYSFTLEAATARERASLARAMVKMTAAGVRFTMEDGETINVLGSRAYDNCWEAGDTGATARCFALLLGEDAALRAAVLHPDCAAFIPACDKAEAAAGPAQLALL
jgi:hypothetical protein